MLLESMEQSTKKEITTERKEKRERERMHYGGLQRVPP